ncbi:MAG: 4-alpha-glucanotransferase [Chloroflexota bacterium]
MLNSRTSGILLHITSLPGGHGIGDLGSDAYRFADFLKETGQRIWQVLPVGPTGYGDSPYQTFSVFAGNPLLIDLTSLRYPKSIANHALKNTPSTPSNRVDYQRTYQFKYPLLESAYRTFTIEATPPQKNDFRDFSEKHKAWLDEFSLFMSLKNEHGMVAWNHWPIDIRQRQPEALRRWSERLRSSIELHKFQQYLFFNQWMSLKRYCNKRGIRLMGDVPIFVALDSAEVWAHPEMFELNSAGKPTVVAGVPPDYFSRSGQLWGNPLYRWDVLERDGYRWWIERFRMMKGLFDIIRLDHFRGFVQYWEVPVRNKTAKRGRWVPGPGKKLFKALNKALGPLPIVVEDLGLITPDVDRLREELNLPGMRVLQFAFGDDPKADDYKPFSFPRNCVVYTGTHDNDTTIGWFRGNNGDACTQSIHQRNLERKCVSEFLGTDGKEINWDLIRLAMMSIANTVIFPLQDVIGLGSEARMNRPGTTGNNWTWRFKWEMLTSEKKQRLKQMTRLYER